MAKNNKEIPVGGIGVINGYKVMAKEYSYKNSCDDCCFSMHSEHVRMCPINKCHTKYRKDKTHVYFVRVEENN